MSESETPVPEAVKRAIDICHATERTLQVEIGALQVHLAVAEAKLQMARNMIDELTRPAPKRRGPRAVQPAQPEETPPETVPGWAEEPPEAA